MPLTTTNLSVASNQNKTCLDYAFQIKDNPYAEYQFSSEKRVTFGHLICLEKNKYEICVELNTQNELEYDIEIQVLEPTLDVENKFIYRTRLEFSKRSLLEFSSQTFSFAGYFWLGPTPKNILCGMEPVESIFEY